MKLRHVQESARVTDHTRGSLSTRAKAAVKAAAAIEKSGYLTKGGYDDERGVIADPKSDPLSTKFENDLTAIEMAGHRQDFADPATWAARMLEKQAREARNAADLAAIGTSYMRAVTGQAPGLASGGPASSSGAMAPLISGSRPSPADVAAYYSDVGRASGALGLARGAAAAQAARPAEADASPKPAPPAQSGDGQTEAYTRADRNGRQVQVKSYKTPGRS